jgi:membrane peptidoglycan carboxypeptidase
MILFIENKGLLDPGRPFLNPAVDWVRFAKALLEKGRQLLDDDHSAPGGSTLATQLEKFRHSERGLTGTAKEKIRQMLSATVRAYLDGETTYGARRQIVLDYLNSVPLAAFPQYGEVNGLGDGLWTWYGTELEELKFLGLPGAEDEPVWMENKARILKQVLSLFIAHRRPADYLLKNREVLAEKCNSYLRLMAAEGMISQKLVQKAMEVPLVFRTDLPSIPSLSLAEKKSANAVRTRLLSLLDVEGFYALDRMDMSVASSIDLSVQTGVTRELVNLRDPKTVAEKHLNEARLLEKGDPAGVIYSFTLYERTPGGNLLRVQTDSLDLPLNINEGIKLDLGSTAKLRTLVHYLEIIAALHHRLSPMSRQELLAQDMAPQDALGRWAVSYLSGGSNRDLLSMLRAAMERRYSANPNQTFFTGGGAHTFENFNREDDHKVMFVAEGFRHSVNLVFIRLMRDIVLYHMYGAAEAPARILQNRDEAARMKYLQKFADYEGAKFIRKFHAEYQKKPPEEAFQELVQSIRRQPHRLSTVYRYVYPENGLQDFSAFLKEALPGSSLSDATVETLYHRYARDKFSLADQGYIARIHPLELWLAAYRIRNPGAGMEEILRESATARQEVYRWLFRPSKKEAQNIRIRIILEMEAFEEIHSAWKRLGYPFDSLVPSLATSIGSSADRPAALAEIMGILLHGGIQMPSFRIDSMEMASGTPYETRWTRKPSPGERVLAEEVARVVREAVLDVVQNGTARRVRGAFKRADGTEIPIGGKTGTGDHRYEVYGPGGRLISTRVMNRTATFAFIIGDRFFGAITALVPGAEAAGYQFTSSLPLAVQKMLAPVLMPLMDP